MDSFFITLIKKKQLTHDVYELVYKGTGKIVPQAWQFLLCDTDNTNPKLRRSYSINDYTWKDFHFIIKKIASGKGGSNAICKQEIGHKMQVWWPTGSFILPTIIQEKVVFIGTGTGFAPLYFQAKTLLEDNPTTTINFIFGVREEKDLFYQDILQDWSQKYPNFSYQFCLSQWTGDIYFLWRVTEYLRHNQELIDTNNLYSICGSPAMVSEAREILSSKGIKKDRIFFEQY